MVAKEPGYGPIRKQGPRRGAASRRGIGNSPELSEQEIEERAKVYGASPMPPKPPVLGPEERAALIPRILELRQEGLIWPLVAKELGVRTAQVERALKDWKAKGCTGPCACGAEGTWRLDPYTLGTHGEEIHVFLCDDCGGEGGAKA